MWRFCLLLVAVFGLASWTGCQCDSKPQPMTADQERELKKNMEQVQQQEQAHFTPQKAPGDKGRR